MDFIARQHPAEWLIERAAPALLGAAAGWSAWQLAGLLAAFGAAVPAAAVGWFIIRRWGGPGVPLPLSPFQAEPIPAEHAAPAIAELLLDDALGDAAVDSRVVQLFAASGHRPGELVTRIADYLGDRPPHGPNSDDGVACDAGAALHEALANIRASLR